MLHETFNVCIRTGVVPPSCNLLDTKVSIHALDGAVHEFFCFVIDEY
jgi:hypothetical protein